MAKNSFLPEDYVEKRKQRRTNVFSLTLFVIVMGAIVGAFFVTDAKSTQVRQQEEAINARYAEAALRLDQLDQLRQQKQEMVIKARVTSVLIERVPRTLILSELINRMPVSLSLIELDLNTKKLASPPPATAIQRAEQDQALAALNVPAADPTEVTLTLVGLAPTDVEVSTFMSSLADSPLIADQSLVYSQEAKIDGNVMRKFKVDLTLDMNVDVLNIEPMMIDRDNLDPMSDTIKIVPTAAGFAPAAASHEAPGATR